MKNQYKYLLVIFIAICISIFIYYITTLIKKDNIENNKLNDEYQNIYKKYGINEYSVVNISNEQLSKIYLNDYKYYLFNDVEKSYMLLNAEYRKKKFGTLNTYIEYISDLKETNLEIKNYSVSKNKKFIEINTVDDLKIIYKIRNIYDYEIYLDDYTVEIEVN